MKKYLSLLTLFSTHVALSSPSLYADLVYVDATVGTGGNTTLSDGSLLNVNEATGAVSWRLRENPSFGSEGTVLEGVEPSPEIRSVISGLVPGEYYDVYAHFWDPISTAEDWVIRVGFESGDLTAFTREQGAVESSLAGELASSLAYQIPPSLMGPESFRDNIVASMGARQADVNGEIAVYVDDLGSGNVNLRTWYDGLSYRVSDWDKDPDGDGYSNHLELSWGTDPNVADDLTGKLSREVWTGISGAVLDDWLSTRTPILSDADRVELTSGFLLPTNTEDAFAERVRGWITAPITGDYTFWISGDNECELWLSTSESKFDRQLIAGTSLLTALQEWDKYSSQQSAPVHLVAGQRYFIECLHKENAFEDALAVAWQVPGQRLEIVPAAYLEPYSGESEDSDWDEMPDSWELSTWGTLVQSAKGNPDGDHAPNWEEWFYGTDPAQADSNVGYWSVERYYGMPYYSIPELVGDRNFYGEPTAKYAYKKPAVFFGVPFAATRMRGYIEVEQSGNYHFWVTGRTAADLYLSTDDTPYRKKRIAYLGSDVGTGHGIRADSENIWDVYSSQMSQEVYLEAGQKYYLETIHQNGHGSEAHLQLAWAPSDGVRTPIPRRNMSFYSGLADDADDDSLPDSWELQYGLDQFDNGFANLEQEGERGDFDFDSLSNREEFLYGTDPTLADSDGDGLSDADEIRTYGTDPAISDSNPEMVVAAIPPNTVVQLGQTWSETVDGVTLNSFRGEGAWNFSVPEDGYWILEVLGNLKGDLMTEELLPVHVSIDGKRIALQNMTFRHEQAGSLRVISPRLTAGPHELGLFIDNYMARRSLIVTSIQVVRPGGMDLDGNSMADGVERQLRDRSSIQSGDLKSYISPVFVEGFSPDGSVDLTLITRSGEVNRKQRYPASQWNYMMPGFESRLSSFEGNLLEQLRAGHGRMEGVQLHGKLGPGQNRWYSEIDLARNEAVGFVAIFEELGIAEHRTVIWDTYNVLDDGELHIPVNSDLLLGAWVQDWDWQTVTLDIEGQSYSFPSSESHVEHFDSPGTYLVHASHPNGETGQLTVRVHAASLPADIVVVELRDKTIHLPGVVPELTLDSGGELELGPLVSSGNGGSDVELAGKFPGLHRLAVRLGEEKAILDVEDVCVAGVSDALRNGADQSRFLNPGMLEIVSPLLITNFPEGGRVRISIFAGGVSFLDGSTVKEFTADDFDEYGVMYLTFLHPVEREGAPCHFIEILNAKGEVIYGIEN